jgi:hypothetical protein
MKACWSQCGACKLLHDHVFQWSLGLFLFKLTEIQGLIPIHSTSSVHFRLIPYRLFLLHLKHPELPDTEETGPQDASQLSPVTSFGPRGLKHLWASCVPRAQPESRPLLACWHCLFPEARTKFTNHLLMGWSSCFPSAHPWQALPRFCISNLGESQSDRWEDFTSSVHGTDDWSPPSYYSTPSLIILCVT